MIKKIVGHRPLRHKLKRRAAALMGTAIMTGAVLSGIPAAKALAAESVSGPYSAKTVQAQTVQPPGWGWHQHKYSWPSSDENQAWYQDGKIYYRSDGDRDYRYLDNDAYYNYSAADFVRDHAASYGFDANRDRFTLLTVNSQRALVEVRRYDSGQLYNVFMERDPGSGWTVVDIRAV